MSGLDWEGKEAIPFSTPNDLLEGKNQKSYAVQWMGSRTDRFEIAQRVSPVNYIRGNLPPIITIHGDNDSAVPYSHAVQLHEGLYQARVPNQLITIPGGGHGGFTNNEMFRLYGAIQNFLNTHLNK